MIQKALAINLAEYKQLLDKERRKKIWRKRWTGKEEKINYFDRRKSLKVPYKESTKTFESKRWMRFFDTETFEFYQEKDNPEELPAIVPYAIGFCTDKAGSYVDFIGLDATKQFLDHLFNNTTFINDAALYAFNLDYDFHAIRPSLLEHFGDKIDLFYAMTEEKKFIYGGIKSKKKADKKIDIKFVDLWKWDTTQSLKSYINNILKITYNSDGSVKEDEIAKYLHHNLVFWGFTKESFKKLEIDYKKVNLHQVGDKWYYYSSKEDWINDVNKKELDLSYGSLEREYLRVDVTSLPLIALEQKMMRELALKTLGLENPIDKDCYITAAGFAKYLCEEYEKKYMTETYRIPVTTHDYRQMLNSYTGAFVAGNKEITYLDEEVFKQMYPGVSFINEQGEARIKSYDVNSMYPWAMSLGLPYGEVWDAKPKGECVTWYEIEFTDYIDPANKKLYKWKDKYSYLNNSFFGDKFHYALVPGKVDNNKVYVLKELYELFISMNDAKCRIVKERYQLISKALVPFVEKLYTIKRNESKQYSDSQVTLIKLILNSLYGKMAERFRLHKHIWSSTLKEVLVDNWDLFEKFNQLGIEVLTEEVTKRQQFKSQISPYLNTVDTSGFYKVESQEKRFDLDGEEKRESITAGIFITSISRWKLLSTLKGEIDQGNVVLYCDTDSLKLIELYPPKFQCHDKELGAWKNEGDFYYFGHPNVKKKYFMFNPNKPAGDKKRWMVKSSGFDDSKLLKPGQIDWDLDLIRTVYNPNNIVVIKDSKPNNKKNKWFQPVIGRTDYKFTAVNSKDAPTHYVKEGVIYNA